MKYLPKTRRGEESLNKILNAAIAVIAEKGFNNASISEITSRAGVSHGLFYFYFKNKDELLEELVRRINRDMRHHLTLSTSGLSNRVTIEKRGFEAFFDWMYYNQYLYKILIEAESNNLELYKWHYMKLSERYSQKLLDAMNRGEIAKYDPEVLSFVLMGIADFIAKRYILWVNSKVPRYVVDEVNKILERILSP
jgi:Transcriptional regulator